MRGLNTENLSACAITVQVLFRFETVNIIFIYAAATPDSAEWVNTAGHLATGSWGSSLTDIACDVLEPEEKTRKPAMIAAGLLTGNIAQGAQALEFVPGDYSVKSVAESGLAASANALGTEKYFDSKN